jgi:transposase
MPASYLPYEPDQDFLLPPSMREWLPDGHLAFFISDTVEALDLAAFHARYDKAGPRNQPFHPAMMVKVLLYGYATGVFSSRKIAAKLHEDVAFRVLAAGNSPAHRTIRDFRAFHLKELSDLFVQVVKLAREMGLVKLGTIAVDGTKVKANASRHKAMSYSHMVKAEAELKKEIDALLDPAYNAQLAVDQTANIIVAAEVTNNASDAAELNFTDADSRIMKRAGGGFVPKMLQAVQDNLDAAPAQVLADTGYRSEAVFAHCADGPTELVVALGREGKQQLQFDPASKPHTAAMAAKLQTGEGQRAYRKRKWIAEPPSGWIKNVLGFRQFSLRGLHRVDAEWKLICAALNLRRMCALRLA